MITIDETKLKLEIVLAIGKDIGITYEYDKYDPYVVEKHACKIIEILKGDKNINNVVECNNEWG